MAKQNNDKAKIIIDGEVVDEVEKCRDCGEPLPKPKLEHGRMVSECKCGATYTG